jgi:MoaA/NifB/PqqE/SkfB family radical SAM enzyme
MWKQRESSPTEIRAAGFKDIVKSLKMIDGYTFKRITFAGGEPLAEPGILDLVNVAAGEGFFTVMSSNGYLIDEKMAEQINSSGLNSINLSLDSYKPQTHDFLRGVNGSYQRVIKAVENLAKSCNNLSIGICTVIMQSNLDELVDLIEWVKQDNRIDGIAFQAIVQPFNTIPDEEWFTKDDNSFLWPKDLDKTQAIIDNLIDMKKTGNFKIRNPVAQFEIYKAYFANPNNFIKRKSCNIREKALTLNQAGEMSFCYILGPVGNIKEYGIKDILFSKQADEMRMKMDNCRENCNLLVNCYFENE